MKSILLVEDSKFLRIASERTLVKAGYSVIATGDGEDALRLAHERVPDLVLLDMLLPKLGGPQVLKALKSDPATSGVPVVVLSSLPQQNEDRLKKDGATAYFEKSRLALDGSAQPLLQLVKEVLGTSDSSQAATSGLGKP